MSRVLAKELTPRGITVNCVVPGITDTPALHDAYSERKIEFVRGLHPMKRLGTSGDVAGLVGYLCGEEAVWVSGQCIGVCGALIV